MGANLDPQTGLSPRRGVAQTPEHLVRRQKIAESQPATSPLHASIRCRKGKNSNV